MEVSQTRQEENEEMINMNIKQFIEATRQYLFDMAAAQPALVSNPLSGDR
jgi:short-subunit dehydrogenase